MKIEIRRKEKFIAGRKEIHNLKNNKEKIMAYSFMRLTNTNKMLKGFAVREQWTWRLIFVFGLLLRIRIGDILNLRWNNFFDTDGTKKEYIKMKEKKNGQMVSIWIPPLIWKELILYFNRTGVDPSAENYSKGIFTANGSDSTRIRVAYRRAFKEIVSSSGIDYPVSIHGTRNILEHYGRDKNMDKKEWEELLGITEEEGIVEEEDLEEEEEVKEDAGSL